MVATPTLQSAVVSCPPSCPPPPPSSQIQVCRRLEHLGTQNRALGPDLLIVALPFPPS